MWPSEVATGWTSERTRGDQGADLVLDRPDDLTILVYIELETPQTAARLEALVDETENRRAEYRLAHRVPRAFRTQDPIRS